MAGPLFVSVGTPEKLAKFLDLNPSVDRASAFVDGEDMAGYDAAGFGSMDGSQDSQAAKEAAGSLRAPTLGAGQWWKYLTNTMALTSIPEGMKFGDIPPAVIRLGGTFAVDGDRVLFAHADRIPGDHPDLDTVLGLVGAAGPGAASASNLSSK